MLSSFNGPKRIDDSSDDGECDPERFYHGLSVTYIITVSDVDVHFWPHMERIQGRAPLSRTSVSRDSSQGRGALGRLGHLELKMEVWWAAR